MSQIFEALRRSRGQGRDDRPSTRTGQADAVLASLGFASERKRRSRGAPTPLLLALLAAIAWLGWSWYGAPAPQPTAQRDAPRTAPPPQPSAPRQAPRAV